MEIFLGILAGVFALAFGILLIVYLVKTHMDKNTIAMYSCKLTAREIDLKNLKMDQASANSEVFAMQSIVEKLRTESSEKDAEIADLQHLVERKDLEVIDLKEKIKTLRKDVKDLKSTPKSKKESSKKEEPVAEVVSAPVVEVVDAPVKRGRKKAESEVIDVVAEEKPTKTKSSKKK